MSEQFEINEIESLIDLKDKDYAVKLIGDRIKILDFSSMSHKTGMELEFSDYEELDEVDYFIVAETDKKVLFKTINKEYKQDLIIANPTTKKLYRINSNHVKLK